ncbi:MAG TPA: hypothetical protein VHX61_18795 [Rhizomicrobium sp.]|nr:hypothetical protein [Rhizomicrobium sp.]
MHEFSGVSPDGGYPKSALLQGTDGLLYGTTFSASNGNDPTYDGTLFRISPQSGFALNTLIQGSGGRLYATGSAGGCANNACDGGVYDVSGAGHAPLPSVAWFLPSTVSVGAQVTIAGANYVGASSVVFSGTSASATFSVDASGFLTATVPAGAVSGSVAITTPAGTVTSSVTVTIN